MYMRIIPSHLVIYNCVDGRWRKWWGRKRKKHAHNRSKITWNKFTCFFSFLFRCCVSAWANLVLRFRRTRAEHVVVDGPPRFVRSEHVSVQSVTRLLLDVDGEWDHGDERPKVACEQLRSAQHNGFVEPAHCLRNAATLRYVCSPAEKALPTTKRPFVRRTQLVGV